MPIIPRGNCPKVHSTLPEKDQPSTHIFSASRAQIVNVHVFISGAAFNPSSASSLDAKNELFSESIRLRDRGEEVDTRQFMSRVPGMHAWDSRGNHSSV